MDWKAERNELIDTVRTMNTLGINQGSSGNASIRVDNGYLITPSGVAYEDMREEDIVMMSFDGSLRALRTAGNRRANGVFIRTCWRLVRISMQFFIPMARPL